MMAPEELDELEEERGEFDGQHSSSPTIAL